MHKHNAIIHAFISHRRLLCLVLCGKDGREAGRSVPQLRVFGFAHTDAADVAGEDVSERAEEKILTDCHEKNRSGKILFRWALVRGFMECGDMSAAPSQGNTPASPRRGGFFTHTHILTGLAFRRAGAAAPEGGRATFRHRLALLAHAAPPLHSHRYNSGLRYKHRAGCRLIHHSVTQSGRSGRSLWYSSEELFGCF